MLVDHRTYSTALAHFILIRYYHSKSFPSHWISTICTGISIDAPSRSSSVLLYFGAINIKREIRIHLFRAGPQLRKWRPIISALASIYLFPEQVGLTQWQMGTAHVVMCAGWPSLVPHAIALNQEWKANKLKSAFCVVRWADSTWIIDTIFYSMLSGLQPYLAHFRQSSQYRIKSKKMMFHYVEGLENISCSFSTIFLSCAWKHGFSFHHLPHRVSNGWGYLLSWSSQSHSSEVLRLLRDFLARI